jgi:hypothetical protein
LPTIRKRQARRGARAGNIRIAAPPTNSGRQTREERMSAIRHSLSGLMACPLRAWRPYRRHPR